MSMDNTNQSHTSLSQKEWIAVVISVIVVLGIVGYGITSESFSQQTNINEETTMSTSTPSQNGVTIEVLKEGTGKEVKEGSSVQVHYTGRLQDGTVFDSSLAPGRTPLPFVVGAGQMIPGFDAGVLGMKEGEQRRLTLAPEMAYGPQGIKNPQTGEVLIPANATLVFDVELVDVQ